jgi:hypothetical protein
MSIQPSSWFDVHMYIPQQLPPVVQCTGYIPYIRKPNLNITWEKDSAPFKYRPERLNLVQLDYQTHRFHVLHTLHFIILAKKRSFRFTNVYSTVLNEHLHAW